MNNPKSVLRQRRLLNARVTSSAACSARAAFTELASRRQRPDRSGFDVRGNSNDYGQHNFDAVWEDGEILSVEAGTAA
jgi:hypothetical protein